MDALKEIAVWSTAALAVGFFLDRAFGDPPNAPHIVRAIGRAISASESLLRGRREANSPEGFQYAARSNDFSRGIAMTVFLPLTFFCGAFALLALCYFVFAPLGFAVESVLCFQALAAKSLKDESRKIATALNNGDIDAARRQTGYIVGRDVFSLDKEGIARAAVESVAENASDGVIAPLLYIAAGGAPLGWLYKTVNTMDSMVGYRNERYERFGKAAAKVDDALNYLPSRASAILMIAAAFAVRLDARGAARVWLRDRRKHPSPNSAQTESVCAGALGVRLGGPSEYNGKRSDKPFLGDGGRGVKPKDIADANLLVYVSSAMAFALALAFRVAIICGVT